MLMHLVPLVAGSVIPLDKPILFFGRQPECDVVLLNSRKVSRKHCCIAQIDDHFVVRDLGSMNGVRVNEKNVSKECRVAAGDVVHIGDVGFRLEMRMPDKRPTAPPPPPAKKAGAATAKPPASKPAVGKPSRRVDPKFLSQDLPVAIADEELDFAVEETQRKIKPVKPKPAKKMRPIEEEVLELDDIDIIDD